MWLHVLCNVHVLRVVHVLHVAACLAGFVCDCMPCVRPTLVVDCMSYVLYLSCVLCTLCVM